MTVEEIKIRRMCGQYLLEPSDMRTVVHNLCGVQAQYMHNAVHSLQIRSTYFSYKNMREQLVKNWTIRGTVHVFDKTELGLFVQCGGENYRSNQWTEPSFWNRRSDWALTPERQSFFVDVIVEALSVSPCTRDELKQICKDKGMTADEEQSMFHSWGGGVREMCERGFMHYAAQDEKVFCLSDNFLPIPREKAALELARRYFTFYAPATVHDAMYFFGTSAKMVRLWLQQLPVLDFEHDGKKYFYIETDKCYSRFQMPKCLFLAGFDQLMMGYEKKESIFFDREYMRSIFTSSGIVRATVLLDGNVVGVWSKKQSRLTVTLFQKISAEDTCAIENKARTLWKDMKQVDFR